MFKAICLAALVGTVSVPAHAVVMQAVYTGKAAIGTDQKGVLIDPGSALDGYDYEATFVYDTDLGLRLSGLGSRTGDILLGGSNYGVDTPITSAVLKINGRSHSFPANYWGWVYRYEKNYPYDAYIQHEANNFSTDGYSDNQNSLGISWIPNEGIGVPVDLEVPYTIDLGANSKGWNAGFYLSTFDRNTYTTTFFATGRLFPGHLAVTVVGASPSPVPLPSALPLLAATLAGLAALRRRQLGNACLTTPHQRAG